MTTDDIARLRALCEQFFALEDLRFEPQMSGKRESLRMGYPSLVSWANDAWRLAIATRAALPTLLDEVERLTRERDNWRDRAELRGVEYNALLALLATARAKVDRLRECLEAWHKRATELLDLDRRRLPGHSFAAYLTSQRQDMGSVLAAIAAAPADIDRLHAEVGTRPICECPECNPEGK